MKTPIYNHQGRVTAKRITCAALAFLATISVGWYAGIDMLQRGPEQAFILVYAFGMATITWLCPIWKWEVRDEQ